MAFLSVRDIVLHLAHQCDTEADATQLRFAGNLLPLRVRRLRRDAEALRHYAEDTLSREELPYPLTAANFDSDVA